MVGLFMFLGPVVSRRIDEVGGEDLAGVPVSDGDLVVIDEDQGGCAAVAASDAEVVRCAGVAQGEFAVPVESVVADPVVRRERC